jgi:fucose 4-O-acetylase-like acetyltransferase
MTTRPRGALLPPEVLAAPGRDRVIDLLRAVSILVVVLGHWTMAAVTRDGDGVALGNVLAVSPQLHPLTWVGQVMPLFFFAAGYTNAMSLGRPGRTVRRFVAGRVERVTRPALALVAVWLPLCVVLQAAGVDEGLVATAGANAAMVLWFLAVYLVLALLAPLHLRVHRRSPWVLLAVLPVLTAILDRTQGTGLAGLGFLNYVLVFAFAQELGFLYADGRLPALPRWVWPAGAAGSVLALVLLTGPGPYPVSMIGLPGQEVSNMLPPSVCVVAVGLLQVCLAMWARPLLERWVQGRGPWTAVVLVNRSIMTTFLWHLTAFVAVTGAVLALDLPLPEPGTGAWWGHKLLWVLAAGALTVVAVLALGWVEHLPGRAARCPGRYAVVAAVLVAAGMTMVASAGFADPFERGGVALAGLTFAAAPGALLILLGWAGTRWPAETGADGSALRREEPGPQAR